MVNQNPVSLWGSGSMCTMPGSWQLCHSLAGPDPDHDLASNAGAIVLEDQRGVLENSDGLGKCYSSSCFLV